MTSVACLRLNSAAKYLPNLASWLCKAFLRKVHCHGAWRTQDLPGLLDELQIPVIYARECLKKYLIQVSSSRSSNLLCECELRPCVHGMPRTPAVCRAEAKMACACGLWQSRQP